MPEASAHNYPDVFGFITDSERFAAGPVQVALATRPRSVKAGRQFEVIMLVQNISDAPVDVTVKLQLPPKDQKGQKGRFITGQDSLIVGLQPAEVGYVTLPMSTMPDTAIGSDYMIGMEISAKATSKGERVRSQSGGATFNPSSVSADRREKLANLKKVKFSAQKRRGLLRGGTALETPISVIQGKIGQRPDLQPGWQSLWTMEDQDDANLLLDKYGALMRQRVIPGMKPERMFEPLHQQVVMRFRRSGYKLTKAESLCATRLLMAIINYAAGTGDGTVAAGSYDVMSILRNRERDRTRLEKQRLISDEPLEEPELPNWATAYMQLLAKDERMARVPHRVLPELLFDDLLFDALTYGLRIVERDSGVGLGDDEEMAQFARVVMEKLVTKGEMDFSHAYLPWIMGGLIVTDETLVGDERLTDVMKDLRFMVEEREREHDEDNDAIFEMATTVMENTLKKYGMLNNR